MDSSDQHSSFYRAFEDRFRGSRELIRQRFDVYAPFLDELVKGGSANALDAGCGRGEWLQLLRDKGFDALGVDLDDPMLEACREIGLNVKRADAIAELQAMADDSVSLVSGFHIAEHLPFEQLQVLVCEAHRVLKPGGLLILETPNPENLKVSTLTFFLDPTHKNPIPPLLLGFMTEYYGFARTNVLRLQERKTFPEGASATMNDVIYGVSPDYAIVAQKYNVAAKNENFDCLFQNTYGLTDETLVNMFDRKIVDVETNAMSAWVNSENATASTNNLKTEIEKLAGNSSSFQQANHERISHVKSDLLMALEHSLSRQHLEISNLIDDRLEKVDVRTERLVSRVTELEGHLTRRFEEALQQERAARHAVEHALNATRSSTCWKITAPLRFAIRGARWFARGTRAWLLVRPGSRPRRIAGTLLTHLILWVRLRPKFARFINIVLRRVPWLQTRLLRMAHARGVALSVKPFVSADAIIWQLDTNPHAYLKWTKLLK